MNMVMIKKRILSTVLLFILVVSAIFSDFAQTTFITSAENVSSTLSEDEISAMLDSIRSADNVAGIKDKLDELINRANLTGNDDLKQYAEYAKQVYDLKAQLSSVNQAIDALLSRNSSLEAINREIENIAQISGNYNDMAGLFSVSASDILKKLDESSFAKIKDSISRVNGIKEKIEKPALASEYDRALIDILMLQEAINQELLDENDIILAKAAINSSVLILVSHERSKYNNDEYSNLIASSIEFGGKGNKTKAIAPTNVVMLDQGFKLKDAAICYDGTVLISIDDVLQFINGKVQYTNGTSTMAIVTDDKLIEFTVGKSEAYVNDKAMSTYAPVLSFNAVAYLSVEFIAETFNIAYTSVPDLNVVVMYSNVDQTK